MLTSLVDHLESTVRTHADRPAIVGDDGAVTFGELRANARHLAAALVRRGGAWKQPVAVYLPKGHRAIGAFLGCMYAGGSYTPLDVKQPVERTRRALEALGPRFVVTTAEHAGDLPSDLDLVDLADLGPPPTEPEDAALQALLTRVIDTDVAYIKFTSGSTGTPKGVVLPHRAVLDYIDWSRSFFEVTDADVIGNQAPLTFDVSAQDIYLCLATGAKLLLVPESHFVFPVRLVEYVVEHRISWVCWVPSALVAVHKGKLLDGADTSSLRVVAVLGEVMHTRPFTYWKARCPQARLVNTYGPTETAIASTYWELDRHVPDDEPLPIGHPCRNTAVLVLAEDGSEVAPGEVGEICIRGSSLAAGYWRDAERTGAAFAAIPTHDGYPERIYRTGDLGTWNDRGELMFAGRLDSQIKHLGYRIELGEIETAAASLPDIHHACVLYDASAEKIALLYVADEDLSRGHLRRQLSALVPDYMLPRIAKRLPAFPLNANGKVDRNALAKEHLP